MHFVTIIGITCSTRYEQEKKKHEGIGARLTYIAKYFHMKKKAYDLCKCKTQGP
jgi:hypothetical protein